MPLFSFFSSKPDRSLLEIDAEYECPQKLYFHELNDHIDSFNTHIQSGNMDQNKEAKKLIHNFRSKIIKTCSLAGTVEYDLTGYDVFGTWGPDKERHLRKFERNIEELKTQSEQLKEYAKSPGL